MATEGRGGSDPLHRGGVGGGTGFFDLGGKGGDGGGSLFSLKTPGKQVLRPP